MTRTVADILRWGDRGTGVDALPWTCMQHGYQVQVDGMPCTIEGRRSPPTHGFSSVPGRKLELPGCGDVP